MSANFVTVFTAFFLIFNFLFFPTTSAVTEGPSDYGTLVINNDEFTVSEDGFALLQISGTVENSKSGVRVDLMISKPDGSIDKVETIPNNYGEFSTTVLLDANWQEGDYTIQATYLENEIGSVSFVISEINAPDIVTSSTVGTINIEDEEFLKSKGKTVFVKITGTIKNYEEETEIVLNILKPDNTSDEIKVFGQKTGEYTARITVRDDWPVGIYQVSATYDEKDLGMVSFTLKELEIPSWVKNNAKWWSEGAIDDNDFALGIQFLITEDIMRIPQTSQTVESEKTQSIPEWVKKNAGWWAGDLISDEDFVQGIEFLVKQGIIRV